MTSLSVIGEIVHRQLLGNNSDEVRITLEEIIEAAKVQYATETWLQAMQMKREFGHYEVGSELLTEIEKDVINNEIDISDLNIMRSIPFEMWISSLGGVGCDCRYIKSTVNLTKILCDDDSLGNDKTFYVVGNKIKFPQGVSEKKIPVIYANDGSDIDGDEVFVNDAVAGIVRVRLIEQYLGKLPAVDMTNNSSPVT